MSRQRSCTRPATSSVKSTSADVSYGRQSKHLPDPRHCSAARSVLLAGSLQGDIARTWALRCDFAIMQSMSSVAEIKRAIDQLTPDQRVELERQLHPIVDDEWDDQMKHDAASGKLDGLLAEVDRDVAAGALRELP